MKCQKERRGLWSSAWNRLENIKNFHNSLFWNDFSFRICTEHIFFWKIIWCDRSHNEAWKDGIKTVWCILVPNITSHHLVFKYYFFLVVHRFLLHGPKIKFISKRNFSSFINNFHVSFLFLVAWRASFTLFNNLCIVNQIFVVDAVVCIFMEVWNLEDEIDISARRKKFLNKLLNLHGKVLNWLNKTLNWLNRKLNWLKISIEFWIYWIRC